jgi:IclR family transcriptional regulator, mhp operon transcriptional activator
MERRETVYSVARALSVVEALNLQCVTPLEALHRSTGMPKPTLIRLLQTLIAAGYVCRVSRKEGYALTQNALRLTAGVRERDVLVGVARPLMEAFTLEHKWQLSLGTRENEGMLIRATTRHISPFSREQVFLNKSVGLLSSTIGRAYFAFCSDVQRKFLLEIAKSSDSADARIAASPACVQRIVNGVRRGRYAGNRRDRAGPYRSLAIPLAQAGSKDTILGAMVMFWYGSVMTERQAAQRYLRPLYDLADEIARGVSAAQSRDGSDVGRTVALAANSGRTIFATGRALLQPASANQSVANPIS